MIPEIGHYALVLALGIAAVQAVLPLLGAERRDAALMDHLRATIAEKIAIANPRWR